MFLPYAPLNTIVAVGFTLGYLSLYALATWVILLRLFPALTRLEKVVMSTAISVLLSSWITFAAWYVFGQQFGTAVTIVLPIVLVVWHKTTVLTAFASLRTTLRHHWKLPKARQLPQMVFWLIIIGTLAWLTHNHFLRETPTGWESAGNTWADLALHMSLASKFLVQGVTNLSLPVFPDTRLTYPFLIDLHSSQLYALSHSWQLAFGIPSFTLILSSCYMLYRFAFRISGSKLAGALWVIFIICSGTAAGTLPLWRDILRGGYVAVQDYSHLFVTNPFSQEHFANFMTSHLLPQRSYVLGLGLAASLLLILLTTLKQARSTIWQWIVVGTLIGLMPFAHVHSYLVLMGLLGLTALYYTLAKSRHARGLWIAVGIGVVLALPQILWQFGGSYHDNFSYWHFGWLTAMNSNILEFWWINLGLLLIFIPLSIWKLRKSQSSPIFWLFLIEAILIFTACNLYIFQPNEWDNMKFLSYAYMGLTLPVVWVLAKLWHKNIPNKIAISIALIIIIAPGIQSIVYESTVAYTFLSPSDLALANYVSLAIPTDQTILTTDKHNHPITTLTGRPIVMGYRGWLSSYGIDYRETERDIASIWTQTTGSDELVKKHHIRYIAINDDEVEKYSVSIEKFDAHFTPIYTLSGWHMWRVDSY